MVATEWEKLTANYLNLPVTAIDTLWLDEYLAYRKDAFISALSKTEAGRNYLSTAARLEMTKLDRTSLRQYFGK